MKNKILDTIAAEARHLDDVQSNIEISKTMQCSLNAQQALQSKARADPDDVMDFLIEQRDNAGDEMGRWASEWDASDTTGVHNTNASEYILSALGSGKDEDDSVDITTLRAQIHTQAPTWPSVASHSENEHAEQEIVRMPSAPRSHGFNV